MVININADNLEVAKELGDDINTRVINVNPILEEEEFIPDYDEDYDEDYDDDIDVMNLRWSVDDDVNLGAVPMTS